jgi:hypothetical protein
MTEESITSVLQKVLDNLEKQTLYLENLQSEESKNKTHETWNFHEENFACYEKNELYPHIFHTANPQLNNIACMLTYVLKNVENICIKLEVLDELFKFLKGGEDKGKQKQIEIPQNQLQEKTFKLEETSESTQLRIKPPSNYF